MALDVRKICLWLVVFVAIMLLTAGAGCVGEGQTQENDSAAKSTPVPEPTATAVTTTAPKATTTTPEPMVSGNFTTYNVTGANVVLTDQTEGQAGITGIAAAENTTGTLVLAKSASTYDNITLDGNAVPVYSAFEITNTNADFSGLVAVTYEVSAEFIKKRASDDPTKIAMMHYDDANGWVALDTFYLGVNQTGNVHYYASATKNFSPFAIVSVAGANVDANVYDTTNLDAYPVFVGDKQEASKIQTIMKVALNNVLTEVYANENKIESVLEDAIKAACSSIEGATPASYRYDSGGGDSGPIVPPTITKKSNGGNVLLVIPGNSGSSLVGLSASSSAVGTLSVSNVVTATAENPIDDIDISDTVYAEVYQTMDVSASGLDGNVFLNFTVPATTIIDNNWDEDEIALLHKMSNGNWEILPTAYDDETGMFTARAPTSFSQFAIANVFGTAVTDDLGNLEVTVLRFASTSVVAAKSVEDYYLSQMIKIANPPLVWKDLESGTVPGLAKECYYETGDTSTWIVVLDDEYVWSDGKPVTSEDLIWSLEKYGFVNTELSSGTIQNMRAEDEKTVVIELINGSESFDTSLITAIILPKHFWNDKDTQTYTSDTFIGCGPYYVEKIDLDNSVVTFTRNPYWAGKRPYYDKVEIHSYELMEGAIAALKRGEADAFWTYGSMTLMNAQQICSANSDLKYEVLPGFSAFYYMSFNMVNETSPAYNATLRKAISYALDYDYIINAVWKGDGGKGDRGLIPHTWEKYPDDANTYETVTYDTGRAKELLKEAGFADTDNDGILEWNGEEVKIRVLGGGDAGAFRHDAAELVAVYLENLGLDVDLDASADVKTANAENQNSWFYKKWAYQYDVTFNSANAFGLRGGAGIGDGSFLYSGRNEETPAAQFGLLNNIKDEYFKKLSDDGDLTGILDYYAANTTSVPLNWKGDYIVYSRHIDGWEAVANMRLLNIPCLLELVPDE